MKATEKNLQLLTAVFCTCLVISNVVTGKIVETGIPFAGSTITVAGAVFIYWLTFLITDVVGEVWGKKEAQGIVWCGFFCQVVATVLIILTQFVPAVDPTAQDAYVKLLGQNWVFVIGSLSGYLCSQSWDVFVFHKIREWWLKSHDAKHRWIWNCASTITSQVIDTVIFITIAFGVGFGWLFSAETIPTLIAMMVGQYFVKFLSAIVDTPFFYLLTRKK